MAMSRSSRIDALWQSGIVALGLLAALSFATVQAQAQQDQGGDDYRPILDRLDRLERDLNLLQRQVYRGKLEDGDTPAPSPGAPPGGPSGISGNAAADMEVRMSTLESQMRSVTGGVEEERHSIDELRTRLDKLVADVDMRLTAIEQKAKGAESNPAVAAATEPTSAAATKPPGSNAAGVAGAAKPGEKTETAQVAPGAATAGAEQPATASTEESLPQGSPMEQYQFARAQLAKADYPGAEKSLRAFLKAYPNNELTENAEYWLAETYYVRSDYTNAAVTYADGYKRFSNGSKAPDNLLKLGLSLGNLGQNDPACKAFAEIDKKFPTARADIRDRAAAERKQRNCR
ncbi:MAG: tol-pal system protein YbgF [Alphaproteobacteria bacterium]